MKKEKLREDRQSAVLLEEGGAEDQGGRRRVHPDRVSQENEPTLVRARETRGASGARLAGCTTKHTR